MTTMDESMFTKGKQPCFVNDTSGTASNDSQYYNLNLKQAHKCLNGFSPIHSHSKSNNGKYCEISQEFDKDGKREKSKSMNKPLNLCLAAIKIGDKDEEQWKKGESFEVADNSTLSLHICAYENEVAAFDSFGGKNNEALKNNICGLVRNEKKLLTSTFIIQNPFEFPRQQSGKVQDPEVSQFRASQRLLNSNAASKNGQQGSSNSNSAIMAEELPPGKRTSTRSNRGINSFFDDYVVEKTPNKKVTKQAKMVEAAEPIAKVERRGRPKKSTSVASEEIKTEIPEPIVDQQEEDEPARKFAKRGRPRKSPVTKENDAAEEVGDHNENEENIPTTPSTLSDATETTSATKVAPTRVQPKIVSPLINDIKETPRYNRGTKRHNDDFVYYGGTQPKKLREMKSTEPAEKLTPSPVVTKPIVKSASTAMKSKVPKIVYPLLCEERQSSKSKTPLVKVGPTPRPTIRFLKPLVHSLGQKPQTSSDSLKMSALKEALFIQRPSTTDFTPLNGPTLEKENVRTPLQIQTNSSSSYKSHTQSPRPQTSTSSSKVSPSIITFANYPNNLLSLEPNVKYCLVNQNGKLMYPASELEESSSELEPSSSPPVYRFFEPCPDYFLTVL